MAQKCVHQGCGKTYTDSEEDCKYHPGPPVFHEGQKGTCKSRPILIDKALSLYRELGPIIDIDRLEMLQTPRPNL
jgi:hypothetical protein